MTQSHTSASITADDERLLHELVDVGAGARATRTSADALADAVDAAVPDIRERLWQLAEDGSIRLTVVDCGILVAVTATGRSNVDISSPNRLEFTGHVVDGQGRGRNFVSLDGYARQFRRRLGYEPYPGTLNVRLDGGSASQLDDIPAVPIDEWSDGDTTYGAARCYPAEIETAVGSVHPRAHVLVPDRTSHDTSVLELVAPTKLRIDPAVETDELVIIHV